MSLSRRQAIIGLAGLTAISALPAPAFASGTSARIVVVGGGFGGASAASYLKRLLPAADITLIEPNGLYYACPFSNLVIAGERDLSEQAFRLDGLITRGIRIVQDTASAIDPVAHTVTTSTGIRLEYDRLILSPGIDFRWGAIDGYDEAASSAMPHAWKAGLQTLQLRNQLRDMPDGGLVVMSVPPAPFRCPPGPYERASLIGHYLKTHKPRSRLLILDAKDSFSKMPLFREAWARDYPDHIEWRGAANDGRVVGVDSQAMTLSTDFETIKANVANVIPPQKAGWIADHAGVTDATGWCPINPLNFASTLQPDIHVIGDATIASPMPKSAFSANLQAKTCAIAIANELMGEQVMSGTLINTCYSFTSPEEAVSIVGVYSNSDGSLSSVPGAGGLTPTGSPPSVREQEAAQARQWFETITAEAFG